MDDSLIINLRVAGMTYPLRVKRNEEEMFRKAANEIDYKLVQYKNYFAESSADALQNADYMAMTAIQAVAEKVEWQLKTNLFETRITALTKELDSYLKNTEVR